MSGTCDHDMLLTHLQVPGFFRWRRFVGPCRSRALVCRSRALVCRIVSRKVDDLLVVNDRLSVDAGVVVSCCLGPVASVTAPALTIRMGSRHNFEMCNYRSLISEAKCNKNDVVCA